MHAVSALTPFLFADAQLAVSRVETSDIHRPAGRIVQDRLARVRIRSATGSRRRSEQGNHSAVHLPPAASAVLQRAVERAHQIQVCLAEAAVTSAALLLSHLCCSHATVGVSRCSGKTARPCLQGMEELWLTAQMSPSL